MMLKPSTKKRKVFDGDSAAPYIIFTGNGVWSILPARHCTGTCLYSHHNAFFFDESWKWLSTAVFLIESLVEEDHSPNALVDGSI